MSSNIRAAEVCTWSRCCDPRTPEMTSDAQTVECTQSSKQLAIDKYLTSVQKLQTLVQAKYAISAGEFDEYLLQKFFAKYERNRQRPQTRCVGHLRSYGEFVAHSIWQRRRLYGAVVIAITICILLVNYKLEASNFFMRNIQTMIYPGMRTWRLATLPLIQAFPSLTQFYDETCLVANPLFQVVDLQCQPCERVAAVIDMTAAANMGQYFDVAAPYFVKVSANRYDSISLSNNWLIIICLCSQTNHTVVTVPMMYEIYKQHRHIFQENAYDVRSSQTNVLNLDQLFDSILNRSTTTGKQQDHHLWRINRMTPARILRRLFPKPLGLPETAGIGVERFVAIDASHSPAYALPETDCSNMFVHMAKGTRTIHFLPTNECQATCRSLSFLLEENTFGELMQTISNFVILQSCHL